MDEKDIEDAGRDSFSARERGRRLEPPSVQMNPQIHIGVAFLNPVLKEPDSREGRCHALSGIKSSGGRMPFTEPGWYRGILSSLAV